MMSSRVPAVFLVVALLFAVTSGGSVHSIVPHDHGHSHTDEGNVVTIWQDLHAAFRHEDTKTIALPAIMFLSIALVVVASFSFYSSAILASVFARDPVRGEILRRGIARYRAFG